mmetsp:Transcript_31979/g.70268  ORF Transcript_31979/g.70268 Transcript_31979/m.70268 type:complete len:228 (-) Transcript_31979:416-1099(-)
MLSTAAAVTTPGVLRLLLLLLMMMLGTTGSRSRGSGSNSGLRRRKGALLLLPSLPLPLPPPPLFGLDFRPPLPLPHLLCLGRLLPPTSLLLGECRHLLLSLGIHGRLLLPCLLLLLLLQLLQLLRLHLLLLLLSGDKSPRLGGASARTFLNLLLPRGPRVVAAVNTGRASPSGGGAAAAAAKDAFVAAIAASSASHPDGIGNDLGRHFRFRFRRRHCCCRSCRFDFD